MPSNNSSHDRDWFKVMPFLDCADCDKEKTLVRSIADLLMKKNQRQAVHVVFIRAKESNENRYNEIDGSSTFHVDSRIFPAGLAIR